MDPKNKTHVDNLFDSKGDLKRKVKLCPGFTRPLYQYTSAEIKNPRKEVPTQDLNSEYYTFDEYMEEEEINH